MAGGTCTQEDIAALMLKMDLEGQDFKLNSRIYFIHHKCKNKKLI